MMFVGAKFCSHCGAKADRTELPAETHEFCPRCRVDMESVLIGKTHLEECPKCEGVWADADSVRQICADQEQQAAVLGMPLRRSAETVDLEEHIHYIPCPICKGLMNRVNFAHARASMVNVCRRHGTWFDKDELRRVVEFIRAGGIEKARAAGDRGIGGAPAAGAGLRHRERRSARDLPAGWSDCDRHAGISAVVSGIAQFLRQ